MSTQLTISGIVLDQGTKKRINGATIKMVIANEVLLQVTDEVGKFKFKNVNEPTLADGVNSYEVSLFAYYNEGRQQDPTPLKITIDKGTESCEKDIKMVNRGPVSNPWGITFLIFLLALLVGLICSYYNLHKPDANCNQQPNCDQQQINPDIVNSLTESLVDRITADSVKVSTFQLKENVIDSTDLVFLTDELQQIKEATNELYKASQIDISFQAMINQYLVDVKQAIAVKNKDDVQAALVNTKTYIKKIHHLKPSWFWQIPPQVYYEILFWALFATILRLISNTSYYVSRNNFLRDTIPHKAVLLFTIPLIALLITFVISFFKITISLGGAEANLDFSNAYVSIILAFLIGLAPWRSWEFMYGLADKLFISLKKWLGLNKSGDEKNEASVTDTSL